MIRRRTPFDEMERMLEQMRRSMTGPAGRFDWGWDTPDTEGHWDSDVRFGGDVNLSVESDDEGYVVLADIPGFEREELDLRFDDGVLTIVGHHETGDEYSARTRQVSEQVRIPGSVVADEISATYRNGVLEIHLPATEDASGHHIEIE